MGRVFLENGMVSEEELFLAFARQEDVRLLSATDVERIPRGQRSGPPGPRNYAVQNEIVPYGVEGRCPARCHL